MSAIRPAYDDRNVTPDLLTLSDADFEMPIETEVWLGIQDLNRARHDGLENGGF